jgi:predicted CXXCH cytochrome family protein
MCRRCVRHIVYLLAGMLFLTGCDPLTRHKVLTTIFDGVPSLPPPEDYCRDAAVKKGQDLQANGQPDAAPRPAENSIHEPYAEKRCNECHEAEKTLVSGGLVKPKNELCFICHPDILKLSFAHGPAAVGDCLACHLPHEASYPFLLARERSTLCDKCHQEKRLAAAMHDRFKTMGMVCVDCHDPHSGNSKYFLK